jgi:hypothetical protein
LNQFITQAGVKVNRRFPKAPSSATVPIYNKTILDGPIRRAWKALHQRYAEVLGSEAGDRLTAEIDSASERLNKS